ncbi:spore coat protein CotJB [Clostridium oryzae]|uniref:CotJB protein n=1 Tax=Clostridium oryzae TaxID=1450648 RepID=A0A1V4IDM1_9CLOT|nr:spore coat protein CotJB [Clostridium oryzae]OPJ58061.1 CotJB protein [Clostridium oryzae]
MDKDMNKMDLLKQIMVTDFMIVDYQLYLDTHPDDQEAITRYNSLAAQSSSLKTVYNKHYGMLSQGKSESSYPWQWINQPWPWEYSANFEFDKEDR